MKVILYVMLFFLLTAEGLTAQSPFRFISESPVAAPRLTVDELGNIYLMTAASIERRNAVGTGVFRTSELQWGEFHDVDVTDPLRPFVHFPSAGKVVFFDNTLSVQGTPVDLFESGFDNAEWMCGSRGDGFWLWDGRNSELVRVDRSFKKRYTSGNLSILLHREMHPLGMMERGSYLYVLCDDFSLQIFDMFGAWKKSLVVSKGSTWMADASKLYVFQNDGQMEVVDTRSWLSERVELPVREGVFYYQGGRLYVLSAGYLSVYEHPENARN